VHQTESLVALQSEASGRYTDVKSCSALAADVTCDRGCLTQLNEREHPGS